jgi:hypothetical protein
MKAPFFFTLQGTLTMANQEQLADPVQDVICSHWYWEKISLFTTGEARASC